MACPSPQPILFTLPESVQFFESGKANEISHERDGYELRFYHALNVPEETQIAGLGVVYDSQLILIIAHQRTPLSVNHHITTHSGNQVSSLPGDVITLWRSVVRPFKIGPGTWSVEVEYRRKTTFITEFDTTGGSAHLTVSKETLKRYPYKGTEQEPNPHEGLSLAPDFRGMVGVTDQGVEGVEIGVPLFRWSEQHTISKADFTHAFMMRLRRMTYKVNDAEWRDFERGSVLFLGARGRSVGDLGGEVTYQFALQENMTGGEEGDDESKMIEIYGAGPEGGPLRVKKGAWEYLWIREEEQTYTQEVPNEPAIKFLVKVPKYVFVERLYDEADFEQLGIPVCPPA